MESFDCCHDVFLAIGFVRGMPMMFFQATRLMNGCCHGRLPSIMVTMATTIHATTVN
jgi:hypothetical protein